MNNTFSRRIKKTPFVDYLKKADVKSYTVYNRTFLATIFDTLESDYIHLNNHVQIWDVSCQKQIQISGLNALDMIQKITPRDLSNFNKNKCYYLPAVNKLGKMLNDPILYQFDTNNYRLSISDSDLVHLFYGLSGVLNIDVKIDELEIFTIAIQGPKAEDLISLVFNKKIASLKYFEIQKTLYIDEQIIISKTGFSSPGGFEICISNKELAKKLWEKIFLLGKNFFIKVGCPNLIDRIEGGLLSYGNDINVSNSPLESGLSRFCDLDKDIDCIGIESIRNERNKGIKKIIKYFLIDCDDIGICNDPWLISYKNMTVGEITSSAHSPYFKKNVAIGMINFEHSKTDENLEIITPFGIFSAKLFSKPLKFLRESKES